MSRARELFPGGVNSPVRAFRGVGGEPVVAARGEGARIWDVDGKEYIDFVLSWGPLVLGHAPPIVLDALASAMQNGTSFGMPTELEVQLGELIRQRMPHLEMMRFVSSGTEATMSAVRLARAFTGRDAILKFEGCYHGHADSFLVHVGSGEATLGLPDSPGVPAELASRERLRPRSTIWTLRRNSYVATSAAWRRSSSSRSSATPASFRRIRASCRDYERLADSSGALLIFDEVMTGFRIAQGGRGERFGVTADLTTLGKVIGGGLPVALYGGRRDIMERVAPSGPVYQAGTLSGNPFAMAAGIATLTALTPALHAKIEKRTTALVEGLQKIASGLGVSVSAGSAGSMWDSFSAPGLFVISQTRKHRT